MLVGVVIVEVITEVRELLVLSKLALDTAVTVEHTDGEGSVVETVPGWRGGGNVGLAPRINPFHGNIPTDAARASGVGAELTGTVDMSGRPGVVAAEAAAIFAA